MAFIQIIVCSAKIKIMLHKMGYAWKIAQQAAINSMDIVLETISAMTQAVDCAAKQDSAINVYLNIQGNQTASGNLCFQRYL
jgi:hypothetical protein